VLKSAPENLAAIRGVAEIHHRQGSFAEALAQYRAALALARNDPDLQRTVDELARQVEPPPPPASADGLSFEQLQDEFLQNLMPPPAAPSPPPASAAQAAPSPITLVPDRAPIVPEPDPMTAAAVDPIAVEAPLPEPGGRDDALRLIAVLERWLDAIHVVRAQPRA
jgi:hypothetical protein